MKLHKVTIKTNETKIENETLLLKLLINYNNGWYLLF